jgi:uncharacterized protein HemX
MAEIKKTTMSEFVKQWGSDQWNSVEWRKYLVSFLENYEEMQGRLFETETVCERQKEEIQSLEKQCELLQKQLTLLQKTLDVAEKFSRPIVISDSTKL